MTTTAPVSSGDTSTLRHEIDRLKSDLQWLRSDVSRLTSDAAHAAKAGVSETRTQTGRGIKTAIARGRASVEAVEEQVSAHPFLALAGALAVGVVLGIGLSRNNCASRSEL